MKLDPSHLDLNLLRVFDALSSEHKVVAAAARLELSAPAVKATHWPGLRRATGDELFTRVPGGMQPDGYALAIAATITEALAAIDNALTSRAPFSAERSARAFRVAMTDIGDIYFLPRLLQAVQRTAPGVALSTVRDSAINLREEMAGGGVDLGNGLAARPECRLPPAATVQPTLCVPDVAEQPAGAWCVDQGTLPGRTPCAGAGRRHRKHQRVDKLCAAPGLPRELVLSVPQFVALPFIVAESELVAVVPEVLAERTLTALKLVRRDLPVALPSFEVNLFWHERVHRDAAYEWLRELVVRLFVV